MTEILDLYNENGEPTGGTVLRGTPVPHGYYLMLVSIMTVRSDGRFLITKRAPEKNYAGRWEITGERRNEANGTVEIWAVLKPLGTTLILR